MRDSAWIFFILTAFVLLLSYLAVRRGWAAPGLTAGVSVTATIICMVLTSLAQGNSAIQAVIVGILLGSVFSGATLGMAWYFQTHQPPLPEEVYSHDEG